MRAIAVATISFGLLDIPARVYAAVESKSKVSFNLLHERCSSRLKQQYVCTKCDDVVERDGMLRGYEFAKDRFVTFTPAELKLLEQAEEPANQRIVITEFVDHHLNGLGLDLAHIERCYYVGPNEGSEKSYATLVRAMRATHRCAIAKYTARGRTQLAMLDVNGDRLELAQLHFAGEVRSISDVPIGDVEPDAQSVTLAEMLIKQLTRDEFKLDDYVDEQQRLLQEHIQSKIDGEEIAAAPTEARPAPIKDAVEALKASLKTPARRSRRRAAAASP